METIWVMASGQLGKKNPCLGTSKYMRDQRFKYKQIIKIVKYGRMIL